MTEKLYYNDSYQFEFDGTVLACSKEADHYRILLDRTCFYPEGGGQPADHGWLNDVEVFDVQKEGNEVVHFARSAIPNGPVRAKIDSARRLDYMQQHTGQHIFSQCLLRSGNYQTLSVHFGDSYTAIETDVPDIPAEKLAQIEAYANRVVSDNLAIRQHWVDPEDVSRFSLRKVAAGVDKVRIIEIDGFDFSGCGGTHLKQTGETGPIKVIGTQKIRGHLRIQLKIGSRVLADYQDKLVTVQHLMETLTCGENDIHDRVTDLLARAKNQQKEIGRLQMELAALEAGRMIKSAPQIGPVKLIEKKIDDANMPVLKRFVDEILANENYLVIAYSLQEQNINFVIGHSANGVLNLKDLVQPLLPLIDGRGGGKPDLMQGGGKNKDGIGEFLNQLRLQLQQERSA